MQAESVLLEPWYEFRLEIPSDQVGRAMSDLQRMNGQIDPLESFGEESVLTGYAPVAALRDYAKEVTAYTRGHGRLIVQLAGYRPCSEADAVIEAMAYDPERDVENTPDSVYCDHGAGIVVKWHEVATIARVDSGIRFGEPEPEEQQRQTSRRPSTYAGTVEQDKELQAIFERTYGPIKRQAFIPPKEPKRPASTEQSARAIREQNTGPEYLLVDGYNIIFAWDDLKEIARDNLDAARKILCDLLCNYQGYKKCEVILVFDAYKVKGGLGSVEKYHNIHVVYTKEAETADQYIEKTVHQMAKKYNVTVATSDATEQVIIWGAGAMRLSAQGLLQEVQETNKEIRRLLDETKKPGKESILKGLSPEVAELLEEVRLGKRTL
jgi:predicted RNA-binding protein with PIN domain